MGNAFPDQLMRVLPTWFEAHAPGIRLRSSLPRRRQTSVIAEPAITGSGISRALIQQQRNAHSTKAAQLGRLVGAKVALGAASPALCSASKMSLVSAKRRLPSTYSGCGC